MFFADSIVKGGAKLTAFTSQPSGKSINASLSIEPSATAVTATLYYIDADMTYSKHDKHGYGYADTAMDQVWQTASLTVSDGKVTGTLPADAKGYYIELKTTVGGKQYVTCSAWITDVE